MRHWQHLLQVVHERDRHAKLSGNKKESKAAAVGYIVVGLFLAPMLIGIPIMLYGFYKLSE